ncbi:MAG: hypothetical protein FD123_1919 [Bacteroidetes bacterium]|nr:MAG: hypothetical protein FD123_1919 [Bacteroidota bacterium]
MKRIIPFLTLFTGLLLSWGCKKEDTFPPEPAIEFKEFKKLGNDSAQVIITFTDGDGDIGLGQEDTTGPFNNTSKYYYNFFMRYYYQDSLGNFKPFLLYLNTDTILDTLDFNYRVPNLTQNDQKESLTGDIIVTLHPFTLYHAPGHNVIRYEIYIVDRELHESNKVMSTDILVQ